MKAFFSIFLIITLLTGCLKTQYAYHRQVHAWEGHKIEKLIAACGTPNKIYKSTGSGGDLYEYLTIKMFDSNTEINYLQEEQKSLELNVGEGYIKKQYIEGNNNYTYKRCFTWFQLDNKKIITQVSYRGELCKSLPINTP